MTDRTSLGRRLVIPAIIAAVVVILDQLTKAWVLRTWPEPYSGEIEIIPGWLAFTYIQNTGVAFGMFQGVPQLFIFTSLIIVAGAIWFYLRNAPAGDRWLGVCLGMIVGGAIGNVIDRVRFGYVVDFVKTFDGRFAIFNVADACISVGVVLMALLLTAADRAHNNASGAASYRSASVEADDGR